MRKNQGFFEINLMAMLLEQLFYIIRIFSVLLKITKIRVLIFQKLGTWDKKGFFEMNLMTVLLKQLVHTIRIFSVLGIDYFFQLF